MSVQPKSDTGPEEVSHFVAAMSAIQALAGMVMTTVLIPSIIGRAAGLDDGAIRRILFATLVSAAVIAFLQTTRIGRFGSGRVMLGGASPAFIGVSGVALASGGVPLLAMLTLCSLPTVLVFVRYAHHLRRVLQPVVMGTIIMLVASSLANVSWSLSNHPTPRSQTMWISPSIFLFTFISILFVAVFSGPKLRLWAPVIGLCLGLIFAAIIGDLHPVNLDGVVLLGIPDFSMEMPSVVPLPIFFALFPSFVILQFVVAMESYSCSSLAKTLYRGTDDRFDYRSNQGAVLVNGVGTLVSGLLGALPTTTYSSSVSIIALTGVTSHRVGYWAAAFLGLLAASPAALTVISELHPVVAAGYLMFIVVLMFGNGMRMATENGLNIREGMVVLAGFWIGRSLQVGLFQDHFGSAHTMIQSAGTSIGGLVTLLLVALLHARPAGKIRFSFTADMDGYRDIQFAVSRYTESSGTDPETANRLLLACEEAVRLMTDLRKDQAAQRGLERYAIVIRDTGESYFVELMTLPTEMDLGALSDRAQINPIDNVPDTRLELAGFRILRHMASLVSHSRYQDADILNFAIKQPNSDGRLLGVRIEGPRSE